jgi:hypothetical protein
MALLNEAHLRSLAGSRASRGYGSTSDALQKSIKASTALSAFTIFLSHSYLDKALILGITEYLEQMGYVVYVDWREDTQLSRDNVTKETAALVRTRIMQSDSLFFATTDSAKDSKWMPWELGYMDGKKGKSAILPIARTVTLGDIYAGQEYLGIYPYIASGNDKERKERLWVHEDAMTYVTFDGWLTGSQPRKHD